MHPPTFRVSWRTSSASGETPVTNQHPAPVRHPVRAVRCGLVCPPARPASAPRDSAGPPPPPLVPARPARPAAASLLRLSGRRRRGGKDIGAAAEASVRAGGKGVLEGGN